MNRFPTAAEGNNSEGELDSPIFELISAISNVVLSLQLCIMNLTALNHRKSYTEGCECHYWSERELLSLYYLADEGRMRKVAITFGIGKSTVLKLVRSWLFPGCLVQSILNIRRQYKKFKKWPHTS